MNEGNYGHYVDMNKKQCLLLDLSCKFYNCKEEITKTSIMNVVMTILQQPYATYFINQQQSSKISFEEGNLA